MTWFKMLNDPYFCCTRLSLMPVSPLRTHLCIQACGRHHTAWQYLLSYRSHALTAERCGGNAECCVSCTAGISRPACRLTASCWSLYPYSDPFWYTQHRMSGFSNATMNTNWLVSWGQPSGFPQPVVKPCFRVDDVLHDHHGIH